MTITVKHNKINQYFCLLSKFFCFLVFWGSCKEGSSGIVIHTCNTNTLEVGQENGEFSLAWN